MKVFRFYELKVYKNVLNILSLPEAKFQFSISFPRNQKRRKIKMDSTNHFVTQMSCIHPRETDRHGNIYVTQKKSFHTSPNLVYNETILHQVYHVLLSSSLLFLNMPIVEFEMRYFKSFVHYLILFL